MKLCIFNFVEVVQKLRLASEKPESSDLPNLSTVNYMLSTVVVPKFLANFSNLKTLSLIDCNLQGSFPRDIFLIHGLQELNLEFNSYLSGGFPSFPENGSLRMISVVATQFSGSLPASISNLSNLSRIDLSDCNFSGSIPSTMAQLTSLTYVDFSSNNFIGSIPNFSSSKNLTSIDFSFNGLTGPLSSKYFEGLSKIVSINLGSNLLSGRIPPSLFSLPSLQRLDLSNNSFDGGFDEYVNVSAVSQLETLDLSSNRLSGSFPNYFFEFPKLSELHLSSNSLGGKVPSSMFSLPSLKLLFLSYNSFDGLADEYVNVLASQLKVLDLSSNCLHGSFPEYFFEFPQLSDLDLSSNSLGGKIPSSMFSLPSLSYIDLSNNSFDGFVDEYVNASTSQLNSLHLKSNRLNGSFPEYFFEFPMLSNLYLSSNSFVGKIPSSMFSLPSLWSLDLSNNSFDGLSDEYMNVSTSQLRDLHLSSNRLNGSFPEYFFEFPMLSELYLSSNSFGEMIEFESLQKLTNLFTLDLSNNEIRGEIPSWIWELGNGTLYHLNLSCNFLESLEKPYTIPSSLTALDLHSNQLRGPLPISPACNDGDGPFYLDYSHNFFNGSIPFCLGSFATDAFFLSLANNSFTGTIPKSICNASYQLEILDLSDNKLGGTLPSCLFNSFNSLGVLNLGKNQIHGSVPDSFTINCSLQSLDLSKNSFEGKIPKSLTNCSLLEVLNVGSNNIVDTFPCALKNLSSLRVLVLGSNNFHGDLHCVNANHMWPNLQIIDIASNNFSGKLSPKFLNWNRMIIDEDTAQPGQYIMFRRAYDYYQDRLMGRICGCFCITRDAGKHTNNLTNYQMAPKSRIPKRQRRETSQQVQNPPQVQQFETFNTPQARERYDTWVSTRDFKKERGIQLEVPEEWNWKPLLLAQPGDACCSVVKEFYANAGDGLDTNTAIVRGVEVDFSSDAINTYYGTEDYYEDDYYHNDLKMSNLTVEMLNEIAKTFDAEAEWNIRNGLIAHMDYKYFTPRDRAIIDFIKAKLIPNSHWGYVRRDQVLLTYCIKEGYTIDVGVLINQSIREIITMMVEKKSRSTLGHPSLITELCRNAGVPMDNHHEVKLKPQAFITPQYIATHYAQAQRPGDADQQEEDVAMGDPDPMPAQPQFPQQFDMQQFFARQEEFMRRQDNFMRRNDEINWYVGTSTYQHNQAAQGFTPHFPPPPPWLQDPQYIPDYYRPHFPPPPDDADHQ
nr:receptor-like protein 12 [Ipomoea trifida]